MDNLIEILEGMKNDNDAASRQSIAREMAYLHDAAQRPSLAYDPLGNMTLNHAYEPQQIVINDHIIFDSLFTNNEELKEKTIKFARDNNIPWQDIVLYIINEFLIEKSSTKNEVIDKLNRKLSIKEGKRNYGIN